jgi:hypothetical protein
LNRRQISATWALVHLIRLCHSSLWLSGT